MTLLLKDFFFEFLVKRKEKSEKNHFETLNSASFDVFCLRFTEKLCTLGPRFTNRTYPVVGASL